MLFNNNKKNNYQQFSNHMLDKICLDKMWGLVSQSGWNDNDAKVVCIQL